MNPLLAPLVELQKIDAELLKLQDSLQKYAPILKKSEDELSALQKKEAELSETLKENKKRRMSLELELKQKEADIAKLEGQQMQVKTNKEYQAVNHEIELKKEEISKVEDDILEFIEINEGIEDELSGLKEKVRKKEAVHNEEKSRIEGLIREKKNSIEKLKQDYDKIAKTADPKILKRFNMIASRYPGNVIVPVAEGNCGGCFLTLTQQKIADVNFKQDQVIFCESCARILVDELPE